METNKLGEIRVIAASSSTDDARKYIGQLPPAARDVVLVWWDAALAGDSAAKTEIFAALQKRMIIGDGPIVIAVLADDHPPPLALQIISPVPARSERGLRAVARVIGSRE